MVRHLCGDALLAHGDTLLASSPSARLWAVVMCGASDDVGALLAAGADPVAVWPQNDFLGISAAALRASADRGAPISERERVLPLILNQYTALHGAAYANDGALITTLASATSRVDVRGCYDCWTPLHTAINVVAPGAVRALLRAGADPRTLRHEADISPLALALELPDTAASRTIVKALRNALAAVPGAAPPPPPPPPSGEMFPDTVYHELSLAGRLRFSMESDKSSLQEGVSVAAWGGCKTCGKHAIAGDDPHGIRGGVKMASLKKCGGCENVFYCGKECQRADWVRHKPECLAEQKAPKKPDCELFILDLGREPQKATIDAAVAEFMAKSKRGLHGRDNPCPTFTTASGSRKYC